MALEQKIEQKLAREVRKHGGLCLKFTSPGTAGMPDRLILMPGGHTAFIEVKAPGQKPRPLQTHRHQQLTELGALVRIIDNPNHITEIINEIQNR
ncbi:VRR-NUC domain-containing protein [Corynebacterium dentalis]|uniref:VRR-NUC domain-containing protein n=1 Tax=Corynebacterium dentalis TaxID=2014528 RepID=UPI0028981223|nr:VRR-NUC domain-containing protein [Corynebacterium dentalis]